MAAGHGHPLEDPRRASRLEDPPVSLRRKARNRVLILLAGLILMGGTVGGYLSMKAYRAKTRYAEMRSRLERGTRWKRSGRHQLSRALSACIPRGHRCAGRVRQEPAEGAGAAGRAPARNGACAAKAAAA